jgi:hypothetical protein
MGVALATDTRTTLRYCELMSRDRLAGDYGWMPTARMTIATT